MNLTKFLLVFFGAVVVFFSSCTKEETTETDFVVPSLSSMQLKTDDFPDGKLEEVMGGPNFNFAATNVVFWNSALALNLILPVAAFSNSFNYTPVHVGNTWTWTYTFNADNALHTAALTATYTPATDPSSVDWTMHISKAGAFSNVLWFSGESDVNGNSGQWVLNADPANVHPVIQIDWTKNGSNGNEVNYIKFMNVIAGDVNNGGYIEISRDLSLDLDTNYNIFIPETNNSCEIEWSKESYNGKVKSQTPYQNALWHCWDTALLDTNC